MTLAFLILSAPVFADVSFIYINGSNNNDEKMKTWYENGVQKLHPVLKKKFEHNSAIKHYYSSLGGLKIKDEPVVFFWGDKSERDLAFVKSQLDVSKAISSSGAYIARSLIAQYLHDAIWVQKTHNMLPILEELNEKITKTKEKIESIHLKNEAKLNDSLQLITDNLKRLLLNDIGADKDLKKIKDIKINFEKNRLFIDERTNFAASTMGYIKNCFAIGLWEASVENSTFKLPRFMLLDNLEDKGIEDDRICNIQNSINDFCENSAVSCQIIISASVLNSKFINTDKVIGRYYYDEVLTGKTLNFKSKVYLSDIVNSRHN